MNEQEALTKMISPGMKRSGKPSGGVIQIWVTRACDKSCFGCTQASNIRGKAQFITPSQFEQACKSLKGYFGVVGMFGGNPALHPEFDKLCDIMIDNIPYKRRGLWCNKLFGNGKHARRTFNPSVSNLNVHLDQEAYDEFKRDWPECKPVGLDRDSRHSPPYIALQDVITKEEDRWKLISTCDINQNWSAMIGVFRNELRGYFCEVAGAQAMLHQDNPTYPDHGIPVQPEWWTLPMKDFAAQVRYHCHACGVPLRGKGELAQATDGVEQTSVTHADVYKPRNGHQLQVVNTIEQVQPMSIGKFTHYLQNGANK